MSILEKFYQIAKGLEVRVGIGLGDSKIHNIKLLKAAISTLEPKNMSFSFFGNKESIDHISSIKLLSKYKKSINFVESDEPITEILNHLKSNEISSIV